MQVSVRELKARLSRYLRLARGGEPLEVMSHNKLLILLQPVPVAPAGLPAIPAVRWSVTRPDFDRPLAELPHLEGELISDSLLSDRR